MKIGPYDIHAGVIWKNEITQKKAVQQFTTSMLGQNNLVHAKILKKEMKFEAADRGNSARGYFTRETIEYCMEAEANNSQFQIEYRGVLYTVFIPTGGVAVTPKRETEGIEVTDPHTGTITFQEI